MDRIPRAVVAFLAVMAVGGPGGLLLAGCGDGNASTDAPQRGAGGDAGSAVLQPTERPAVAVMETPAPREAPLAPPTVMVKYRGGLLTVKAHGAPLGEILAEISRSVGVTFDLSGDAAERLSIDLGPRSVQEVISGLLDRTSYGYAFVDSLRIAGSSRPARVFLLKEQTTGDVSGQAGVAMALPATPAPIEQPSPPDEAALQQQRAADGLFDACKVQGCDTS
jgi:hypothetical protein